MQANTAATAAAMAAASSSVSSYVSLVHLEPAVFEDLLTLQREAPIVVYAEGGFFSKSYRFLTTYRGLGFYCISPTMLHVPDDAEMIHAKKLHLPT